MEDFGGRQIKWLDKETLTTKTGVLRNLKNGLYELTNYGLVSEEKVSYFVRMARAIDDGYSNLAVYEQLLAESFAQKELLVLAFPVTIEDFVRDSLDKIAIKICIDRSARRNGFAACAAFFYEHGLSLTGNERSVKYRNRKGTPSQIGSRDKSWQGYVISFALNVALPLPVVDKRSYEVVVGSLRVKKAGTVGQGRKEEVPIFIRHDDGHIQCTYQALFSGMMKLGVNVLDDRFAMSSAAEERLLEVSRVGHTPGGSVPFFFAKKDSRGNVRLGA